jgi:hypothetical protein
VKKNTAFSMVLARSLPRVLVTEASAAPVGGGGGRPRPGSQHHRAV